MHFSYYTSLHMTILTFHFSTLFIAHFSTEYTSRITLSDRLYFWRYFTFADWLYFIYYTFQHITLHGSLHILTDNTYSHITFFDRIRFWTDYTPVQTTHFCKLQISTYWIFDRLHFLRSYISSQVILLNNKKHHNNKRWPPFPWQRPVWKNFLHATSLFLKIFNLFPHFLILTIKICAVHNALSKNTGMFSRGKWLTSLKGNSPISSSPIITIRATQKKKMSWPVSSSVPG